MPAKKASSYARVSTPDQVEDEDAPTHAGRGPKAFSYVRFSHPDQLKGDSLRRQVENTAAWCERNNIPLDTSLTLRDLGKSAFRGAHRKDDAALGLFLKAVTQGKVPRGSYLVVENLDRLSREDERAALRLWMDILDAGVNIVQLKPETVFRHDKSDMLDIFRAIIELSRGHSESAMKSERNGEKWETKRKAARAGQKQPPRRKDGRVTESMTDQLPPWVEDKNGVLCLIPARAAAVHRVHQLAAKGQGAGLIVKALIDEKRPPLGPSGRWDRRYVRKLMSDRRALGEHQPRHDGGKPCGEPIPGYYPACVTPEEWAASQGGRGRRDYPRGRVGEYINLFAGLLYNAREGDHYHVTTRTNTGTNRKVLIVQRATENGSKVYGFDFASFEEAVLSLLKEIKPKDVLGDRPGQEEVVVLSRELEHVLAEQEKLAADLLKGWSKALSKASRALDEREKELREQLAAAEAEAGNPAGECWGEAMSLIDALDTDPEPPARRVKLRSLLRQLVEEIWILVVPLSAMRRCAAVQVFFESGVCRHYLIFCQSGGRGREAFWQAWSLADVVQAGDLDLRKRQDAAALEKELLARDLVKLALASRKKRG
jgi:DNA invertase Pin-like site-specific DNA recombinase